MMASDTRNLIYIRQAEKFAKELLAVVNNPDKDIEDLSEKFHDFYQTIRDRFEHDLNSSPSPLSHQTSGMSLLSSSFSAAAAAAAAVTNQATRVSPTKLLALNSSSNNQSHDNISQDNSIDISLSEDDQWEELSDNIELVLNEYLYQDISARIINEDEEKIMAFQKRIRSLNWITVEHLDIHIDFKQPLVHDLLDKAICQIIEMNSRTSSLEKLRCIVDCSKTVLQLLEVESSSNDGRQNKTVSADVFLPVIVFVVIQANPPMLPVDMKYINKFTNPRRLERGEAAYYFTQLSSAMQFIETINGSKLNISEQDFEKFVNGEAVPETKSQFSTYLCDGLRTICSNEATLNDLMIRQRGRQSKLEQLFEKIDVHIETNKAKIREMNIFASNLKQKLTPKFPRFYADLLKQNREFAHKILPSYLKTTEATLAAATVQLPISMKLETSATEGKLIDLGEKDDETNTNDTPTITETNLVNTDKSSSQQASPI